MRHRDERDVIEKQDLLELVGDADLEPAIARAKLRITDTDVFVRIGNVAVRGGCFQISHLAPAQKVGHELELLAVPREEVWTGRWLAIELGQREPCEGTGSGGWNVCLQDARGPQHANRVGARASAEPD